jgi:anaerobic selenocysteine-containing dehydrogenase
MLLPYAGGQRAVYRGFEEEERTMAQPVRTVCPHDCPDMCSMLAHVEDGRLVRVQGDPDHAFTGGFLCAKVNRYPERVYSPDRVLYPMRRTGPKGEGRFERISWAEALTAIAERWRAVGPDAILGYAYSGTMGLINRLLPTALFNALGTRKVALGTVCDSASGEALAYTIGDVPGTDPESVVDSDLVIAWGANIITTNVHMYPFIEQARARGAQFIVIDPYRNRTAERADWHIPIKIGTDAALALGIMHILVRDGLTDEAYLREHTVGFDQLKATTLPQYTPEAVAEITGLPAADVERLASLYGRARAPFIRLGLGMSRHTHGGMGVRAVACLPAVVGAWGKRGGGCLSETSAAFALDLAAVKRPDLHTRPGVRTVNHSLLGQELQDPSLKAFFVMANNPASSCPDQTAVVAGLAREDLFTVVHELHMSDTARYADILLPACTPVEAEDLYRSYGHLYFQFGPQVVAPLGESRPNRWVVAELARRMGITDPLFERSTEEHVTAMLAPMPERTAAEVMGGGPFRVPGHTGPVPTQFYSQAMVDAGLPGLPEWQPDPVAASEGAAFSLRLLTAPGYYQHHSHFAGVGFLQQREGAPTCLLHPQDAGARDIADGDPVELFNDRGFVGLYAKVTEAVQPGVAVVEGYRERSRYLSGGPVNVLTSGRLSDMGGGATYQSTWVEARKL